jgi:hypothetical protein
MAKYTDGSEIIDAIQWGGSFSAIQAFLVAVSPFFIDPKVTEDNPDATGVAELPDGRLSVFVGGSTVFEYAPSGDWLARGANSHLRTIDATSFATSWTLVP